METRPTVDDNLCAHTVIGVHAKDVRPDVGRLSIAANLRRVWKRAPRLMTTFACTRCSQALDSRQKCDKMSAMKDAVVFNLAGYAYFYATVAQPPLFRPGRS